MVGEVSKFDGTRKNMTGTALRAETLTSGRDGRSVIVAFDHGGNGVVKGGENPRIMIEHLANSNVDGLLIGPGLMRPLSRLLAKPGAPRMVVAIDHGTRAPLPGIPEPLSHHTPMIPPEHALTYGASAVKMLLPLGLGDRELFSKSTSMIARSAAECDDIGLPLMLEPAFWGKDIESVDDEMIAHATRMSIELGAHILKIPATSDPDNLAAIVTSTELPIYILGGNPGDGESLGRSIVNWIDQGVTGVAIGRSVWSRRNMDAAISGINAAVHSRDESKAAADFAAADADEK